MWRNRVEQINYKPDYAEVLITLMNLVGSSGCMPGFISILYKLTYLAECTDFMTGFIGFMSMLIG
jgi:hypothetical protein